MRAPFVLLSESASPQALLVNLEVTGFWARDNENALRIGPFRISTFAIISSSLFRKFTPRSTKFDSAFFYYIGTGLY